MKKAIAKDKNKIIRTDNWILSSTQQQAAWMRETVALYRAYTKALIGVVWTHYASIKADKSPCNAIEKLTHKTTKNPKPVYAYFDKRFPKFPSYLRRAAIEAALGQVSSFNTRYDQWQSLQRKRQDALPPQRTNDNVLNPPLYRGQCLKLNTKQTVASIKIWNGSDWVWTDVQIKSKRNRHAIPTNKALSPTLLVDGKSIKLSVPFESKIKIPKRSTVKRVCGVDLGINTTAVASVITSDGTVVARGFFHAGADIDRRDKGLAQIGVKARQTLGESKAKLPKGFCSNAYRKATDRNRQMVNTISAEILAFALDNGADAIVFEHLKHFRPAGGRKRSNLRQKFHGWLHRKLVNKVQERAEEACLRTSFVNPAGTSKYAFDGSGEVKRDTKNRSLATFTTGKRYNADLSASYNIGARFFAPMLGIIAVAPGKSSRSQPGTPVTLSSLWHQNKSGVDLRVEAATTAHLCV